MEDIPKKAKISATVSPYLKNWMLERVSDGDFTSTSEIIEIAVAEFRRSFEQTRNYERIKAEVDELKERIDTLQKSIK